VFPLDIRTSFSFLFWSGNIGRGMRGGRAIPVKMVTL
jgi:hypothetical protein